MKYLVRNIIQIYDQNDQNRRWIFSSIKILEIQAENREEAVLRARGILEKTIKVKHETICTAVFEIENNYKLRKFKALVVYISKDGSNGFAFKFNIEAPDYPEALKVALIEIPFLASNVKVFKSPEEIEAFLEDTRFALIEEEEGCLGQEQKN